MDRILENLQQVRVMNIPPPPRTWAQALAHPGIESIEDYRKEFKDDGDMNILVLLMDGWSLCGDLTSFYVGNLADLCSQWGDIEPP